MSPPAAVLAAFGLAGGPEPLAGGQGESWRVDDVVLKPEGEAWVQQILAALPESDAVRIARPILATDGRLVVDGWSATQWLAGAHEHDRYDEIVAAGQAFHGLLAGVPRPCELDDRDDRWADADRMTWGESAVPGALQEVAVLRRPIELPAQLMHGDLGGNVLFAAGSPPAVIDFSPYWRPPDWATAIAVVDAIAWGAGDRDLLDRWLHLPEWTQLVVRGLLFRMVLDPRAAYPRYRPIVDWVVSRSHG